MNPIVQKEFQWDLRNKEGETLSSFLNKIIKDRWFIKWIIETERTEKHIISLIVIAEKNHYD